MKHVFGVYVWNVIILFLFPQKTRPPPNKFRYVTAQEALVEFEPTTSLLTDGFLTTRQLLFIEFEHFLSRPIF